MRCDKIYREDVLWRAWIRGAPQQRRAGHRQTTSADVEEYGVTRLSAGSPSELRAGTWRPLPARKVLIPKPGEHRAPAAGDRCGP